MLQGARSRRWGLLIAFALLIGVGNGWSAVDGLSGGYSLCQTDLALEGGLAPRIERVYHSFAQEQSVFGKGWFSSYDIRLKRDGDVLRMFDPCRGAERIYRRAEASPGVAGFVYRSVVCGCDTVSAQPDGFLRTLADGRVERYDADGWLVRVSDTRGNWLNINRDIEGRLSTIEDNLGRRIRITLDAAGCVRTVACGSASAVYDYDAAGHLLQAQTPAGTLKYRYDSLGRLNEQCQAGEELGEQIGYGDEDRAEVVSSIVAADGTRTYYVYRDDEDDPTHRITQVRELDGDGRISSLQRQDYYLDPAGADELLVRRKVIWTDGARSVREYNEAGLLVLSEVDGERTELTYDAQNRVVRKDTPDGTVTELEYASPTGKVTHVRIAEAGAAAVVREVRFTYSEQGDLTGIVSSDGRTMTLTYDGSGRIITIDDGERQVQFSYNALSKPQTIALKGGQDPIRVEYAADGEISKVEGGDGLTVSLAVTATFQNLMELVSLADPGVGE